MQPVGGQWFVVISAVLLIQQVVRRYIVQRRRWWAIHRFDRQAWAEWEQFRLGVHRWTEALQERVIEISDAYSQVVEGYDW